MRRLSLNDIRERHDAARYWRAFCTMPSALAVLIAMAHRNRRRIRPGRS